MTAQAIDTKVTRVPGGSAEKVKLIFLYAFLIITGLAFLLPFYWMFASAVKPPSDIFTFPPKLIPTRLSLQNLQELFTQTYFLRSVFNSLIVATSATLISLFFCSLGGFGFAKYNFPGKNGLFYFLLGTMMIPPAVTLIPLFVLMTTIGWIDTYWAIIIPEAANAFGIFWMRQYMETIPDELMDAARIDGCRDFGIYWRIILPVTKPAISALAIFLFMFQWNNFMWPLIILRTETMYTIPIVLSQLNGMTFTPYGQILAGSALATLPILVVFFAMQKQFVAGILGGAVKS